MGANTSRADAGNALGGLRTEGNTKKLRKDVGWERAFRNNFCEMAEKTFESTFWPLNRF